MVEIKEHELSRDDLTKTVMKGGGHLVILGAGASRALSDKHNGDKNGIELPLMNELVSKVGLEDLILEAGFKGKTDDFEAVYTKIAVSASKDLLDRLNNKIAEYFKNIEIPDDVTNYDLLLVGLRGRDVVASFNWDPLLHQAHRRLVAHGIDPADLPHVLYLHGNVAIGYCDDDRTMGRPHGPCFKCGKRYKPTPLLYPVAKKNYESNNFIKAQWDVVKEYMHYARIVTVYGYGAPASDVAAMSLLQEGWGKNTDRQFEQFELIIRPGADEQEARDSWDAFIHTHHYGVWTDFSDSYIALTPRRTVETWFAQYIDAKFVDANPYPKFDNVDALIDWIRPLIKAEVQSPKAG